MSDIEPAPADTRTGPHERVPVHTREETKMAEDYAGKTLDKRYSIETLLGRGGMGSVYLGRHLIIGKRVAIKFLRSEFASSQDLVKRFYREAQAASAVEHRNIINVMDVGVSPNGEPFLVMEYLEGESLEALLSRKGPLDLAAACGVLEPTLSALSAAHAKGIVHRDLKPGNIFIVHEQGQPTDVKLIDFGISKFIGPDEQSKLTQTGTMLGTPAYMAPEQVRGDNEIDHRADLYSIGVILYEMLTGKLPFKGKHYNELLVNVLTGEPIPPREAREDFPEEAAPLLLKLLSRDPAERPANADALLDELKALSEYDNRVGKLTLAASGLRKLSFAAGDLGSDIKNTPAGKDVARGVLSEMESANTHPEWSGTLKTAPKKRNRALLLGLAGVGAAIAAGAVFVVLASKTDPDVPASPNPVTSPNGITVANPAVSQNGERVRVEVTNLPSDAVVFLNNAAVPAGMNPFFVKRDIALTKLEIRAPGYKNLALNIVPDKDLTVDGTMKPESTPTDTSETSIQAGEHRDKPETQSPQPKGTRAPRKRAAEAPPKDEFADGFE